MSAEIVHLCPPVGSDWAPCCGRSPLELAFARTDRMTQYPDLVTCEGAKVSAEYLKAQPITDREYGVLDEMVLELVKPLIPENINKTHTPEEFAKAVGLLSVLKGGVVVGDVRIATTLEPYTEPDEDEDL